MVCRARPHDRWIRRAAPLLVVVACGGWGPACILSENSAAVGGAAGTAGNGGGARAGSACESPNEEDYRTLESCNVGNGCLIRRVRGYGNPPYLELGGYQCLLSALRDRTPGRHTLRTDYSDSCQWDREVLVVDSDGNVFVSSAHNYSGGSPLSCPRDPCLSYGVTERCTLKPPSFFDDCLALGMEPSTGGGAGAPDGDWALPMECYRWYMDCESAEPNCPTE
jgi:hypothetical protein